MLNFRLFNFFSIQNERDNVQQSLLRELDNVFIPHDMNWSFFSFHPVLVEVPPDTNFLTDPLVPLFRKLLEISIFNGSIVGPCANHIEKRNHTVQRVSQEKKNPFSVKLGLTIPFRVMSLDNPNSFIYKTLSRKPHEHQIFIKLFENIAV